MTDAAAIQALFEPLLPGRIPARGGAHHDGRVLDQVPRGRSAGQDGERGLHAVPPRPHDHGLADAGAHRSRQAVRGGHPDPAAHSRLNDVRAAPARPAATGVPESGMVPGLREIITWRSRTTSMRSVSVSWPRRPRRPRRPLARRRPDRTTAPTCRTTSRPRLMAPPAAWPLAPAPRPTARPDSGLAIPARSGPALIRRRWTCRCSARSAPER
jgi:hypothetical protein